MEFIDWNELLEDPSAIEASTLQRIIAIGVGRTVNGVTVELHSLELRELGAFGHLRIEIDATRSVVGATVSPELSASDDTGRRYSAMVVGWELLSAGPGAAFLLRCRFSLVPQIRAEATRLVIRVDRLGAQSPMRLATPEGSIDTLSEPAWTNGPWEFEIPLGG